jgi:ubiquinone/menaquinone biosynthesis C-methylase UbiE
MRLLEVLLLRRLRRRIFPRVRGLVLELGTGTGVNLPYYDSSASVVALDRSGEMLAQAAHRSSRACVELVQADVERLPFADSAFDGVSGALVFCSVAAPERGLSEAHRVLQPGGRLVLLEHMRGNGLGAVLTAMVQPVWGLWSSECRLDRETVQEVVRAGFCLSEIGHHVLGIVRSIEAHASS